MTEHTQAPHPSHIVRRICVTGGRGDTQAFILDIFPHRLHPAEGFTREDMILTLIAMLDGMIHRSFYGTHNLSLLQQEALEHPMGVFGRSCVIGTPGSDDTAQQVVVNDGFSIHLWDGRSFDLGDFAPTPFTNIEARNAQISMRNLLLDIRHDPIMGLVVGMVDELLPAKYDKDIHKGPLEVCLQVAARAARLVQTEQGGSGSAGARHNFDRASRFLRDIDRQWICPPDRGWCPGMRLKGARWDELRENINHSLVEAGRKIAKALADRPLQDLTNQAAIFGDDPDLSNHQRMEVKRLLRLVDEMIEDEMPENCLKPAAAKRRAKRAA